MNPMLERTIDAYDTELLSRSRVFVVGTGGSRGFVETLARTGISEMVLIDPDTSGYSNIGTQQAFLDEIGEAKVNCLKRRLATINRDLRVKARQMRFEDIARPDLDYLLREGWDGSPVPAQTVLVLSTDNFYAQAHGNRVALEYGVPSASAQVYQDGLAAEFSFTHPDLTTACNRCALEGRYRAYLEQGFVNQTTSRGAPVFCADRVNSTLGFLTLMVLHHGSDHPRWGDMLKRAGNRNLMQLQMWPDTPLGVFGRVFGGADQQRLFFDNLVWLPQKPDHPDSNGTPACPDCGGTGNLHDARGSFPGTDLYRMRPASKRLSAAGLVS
ncbi:ThiF family adenylyltransferase [Candidatus Symbiobacter mobilis]|uniref:Dinucleotide-utilizing enzyme n=1 Tax=Candidatus Symbiobacter mobilis CR TaxID=946483 RepID=U5NER0_9BURK|nr:ThiF family adenylyltransferase [Candidatus Symbiobacter mobilis]AGX88723.1 dinucleotide-utilizing enzyme [Candidatus Symbiobacter mobilis CR]